MTAWVLLWAALAAPGSASPDYAACVAAVTPEKLLVRQFGAVSREGLMEYASCRELVERKPGLCQYLPGGQTARGDAGARRDFEFVGSDGNEHDDYEFGICDSRSAGYAVLPLLVSHAPPQALLPFARRMLEGETSVTPQALVDDLEAVYSSGDPAKAKIAGARRAGLFDHLAGRAACRRARSGHVRRECERKAVAIEALKAGDVSRCVADDALCRALFAGDAACAPAGQYAVSTFCAKLFPKLKEDQWKLVMSPL